MKLADECDPIFRHDRNRRCETITSNKSSCTAEQTDSGPMVINPNHRSLLSTPHCITFIIVSVHWNARKQHTCEKPAIQKIPGRRSAIGFRDTSPSVRYPQNMELCAACLRLSPGLRPYNLCELAPEILTVRILVLAWARNRGTQTVQLDNGCSCPARSRNSRSESSM
jgi:hypothetical protein